MSRQENKYEVNALVQSKCGYFFLVLIKAAVERVNFLTFSIGMQPAVLFSRMKNP